jgi:hypothetical protein
VPGDEVGSGGAGGLARKFVSNAAALGIRRWGRSGEIYII